MFFYGLNFTIRAQKCILKSILEISSEDSHVDFANNCDSANYDDSIMQSCYLSSIDGLRIFAVRLNLTHLPLLTVASWFTYYLTSSGRLRTDNNISLNQTIHLHIQTQPNYPLKHPNNQTIHIYIQTIDLHIQT